MSTPSTHHALSTPELLIAILSHLPFSDLLIHGTLVSKTWHTTILSTPSLLRILYMHPSQPQIPTSLHPFLQEKEKFPLYLQFPRHERQYPDLAGASLGIDPSLSQQAREETPLERFNFQNASWRRMLVLTGLPLITRARVKEMIEVGRDRTFYERMSVMHFPSGFRMGDLWRLCENRWSRRLQPLQAVVNVQWMRGGRKRSVVFHSQIVVNTTYKGGNQGFLGWVFGVRERRKEKGRERREGSDQMCLERLEGVEYGGRWGEVLGEEEIEVDLMMVRASARLVKWEEFRVDDLKEELARKGFAKAVLGGP
ncbi:hypothetical protein IFR05_003535 [Cadophora sp. M221]|nr:hypothetical protein IFR05_003535 [Cadophora sp. M221]